MAKLSYHRPEIYERIYAVPNGGLRNARVASQLQAEGVKPGIPDLTLPVARNGFHGLYVELKTPSGSLSRHQETRIEQLAKDGYEVLVASDAQHAFGLIVEYFDAAPTAVS